MASIRTSKPQPCRCGCGRLTPVRHGRALAWIPAHKEALKEKKQLCACGCGEPVRRVGHQFSSWKRGHSRRKYGHDPVMAKKLERISRVYGLTAYAYFKLLEDQDGRCAICGTDDPGKGRGGEPSMWSVDHCHTTGTVRALLCRQCNAGLGSFKDDPILLEKAKVYLESHSIRK